MRQSGKARRSKTDLEKSLLDIIAAGRRLLHTRENDTLWAGTYSTFRQDLRQYEMRIRRTSAKGKAGNLDRIAEAVVERIGDLCKALIRYICPFHMERKNKGASEIEYRTNFKDAEGCS